MLAFKLLVLLSAAVFSPNSPTLQNEKMSPNKLDKIFRAEAENIQRPQFNVWQFTINELPVACVIDTSFDRMRLIAPIIEYKKVTPEQKDKMLAANFHSALDARYCTNDGIVYSAFIHPLSPLTSDELRSALRQVFNLAATFGSDYTSGVLSYGEQP